MNLSRFDEAYSEEGQKAYNPRLMLKLWLYGFAVNVRSTRKLERRVQEDLGFRFLAGGLRPDHKTLSEFLRRHGEAIEPLFTQVLGWARKAGMARLGRVAIDSTRIKANASPDRLRQQDERQVRQWRRAMEAEDPDQEPGLEVGAETVERLRREMGRASGTAAPGKQSLTDPDARFLRERGGRFRLGYSGEIAVSEDHFIVAVRVTQNATDNASLLPMVAEVERQCRARPKQVLADSGFYSGDNLDALEAQGIDGYVPDSNLARELNLGKAREGKSAAASPSDATHAAQVAQPRRSANLSASQEPGGTGDRSAERTAGDAAVPASWTGGSEHGTAPGGHQLQPDALSPSAALRGVKDNNAGIGGTQEERRNPLPREHRRPRQSGSG